MKFPTYPETKPSGVDWLGEVPEHWVPVKFGLKVRVQEGQVDPTKEPYCDMPMIAPNHIASDTGVVSGVTTALEQNASSGKYRVHLGDVVYSKIRPHLNKCALSDFEGLCSADMYPIRPYPSKDIHSPFLAYWIIARPFHDYATESSMRVAMPKLNRDTLSAAPLVIPPVPEQRAIADFLDAETAKLDTLIDKKQSLIEKLQEKRSALISRAVTRGLNPDAPLKPSGIEWLGDVPEHWKEYPLKALLRLKHGYAFDGRKFSDSGEYVLLTPGNFRESGGFRPKVPEKFYTGTDVPEKFILKSGQMLVAMTEQASGLLGSALFVPSGEVYLHNQRLGLVQKLRHEKASDHYLFYLFNSGRFRAEVSISSTGTKVKHTSPEKILSIKVLLPPLSEQKQISKFLDRSLGKIDTLESQVQQAIELLQESRTTLITAAVTGKIDVRNHKPA